MSEFERQLVEAKQAVIRTEQESQRKDLFWLSVDVMTIRGNKNYSFGKSIPDTVSEMGTEILIHRITAYSGHLC